MQFTSRIFAFKNGTSSFLVPASKSVLASLLGISGISSPALAHSRALDFTNFVTSNEKVWVGVRESNATVTGSLGRFEIGKNEAILISKNVKNEKGIVVHVMPDQVLTFIEGLDVTELSQQQIVHNNKDKGLYLLSAKEYRQLAADESLYLVPITFKKVSEVTAIAESARSSNNVSHPTLAQNTSNQDGSELESSENWDLKTEELVDTLRKISGEEEVQVDGAPVRFKERKTDGARKSFRKWLVNSYVSNGVNAKEVCYTKGFNKGCNVEALLPGKSEKTLYVTSHLDTVANAPGADDNGSATALLVNMAKAFREKGIIPELTIKFVSFDQEEIGLVGSGAYVSEITKGNRANIVGTINMDMIGYNGKSDGAFHAMDCDRKDSSWLLEAVRSTIKSQALDLKEIKACTNRSDHAAFWENNIPAIVISENFFGGDSNPCYHKSCDKIDRMSLPYYTKLSNLVTNTVWSIASKP